MAKGAHLRITNDSLRGVGARISINGQDIGPYTRDIQLSIPLSGAVTATIEILVDKLELDLDALMEVRPYLHTAQIDELKQIAAGLEKDDMIAFIFDELKRSSRL